MYYVLGHTIGFYLLDYVTHQSERLGFQKKRLRDPVVRNTDYGLVKM